MAQCIGFRVFRGIPALVAGILAFAVPAFAAPPEGFPNRPITLIIPYGAGGAGDTLGRTVAVELEKRIGQPVVPENRPGATGNIGMAAGARAKPDGYTLTLVASNLATNPYVYTSMSFDPFEDLVPVTELAKFASILVVNPSLPIKDMSQMIAAAKDKSMFFGSAGMGSSGHLAMGLLNQAAGIELENVPYQGEAPAVAAVLANDVQIAFATPSSVLQHIAAGKLTPIGITSAERSQVAPNVPAISETVKGYEATGWFGITAPKGTDPEIVAFYAKEIKAALESPEASARLRSLNLDPRPSTPEAFAAFIKSEAEKYEAVIKAMNLKLD